MIQKGSETVKIGVKFCGGCNPGYERSKIVKRICAKFPQVEIEPVREESAYDLILLISGCHAECLSVAAWQQQAPVISIYQEIDYDKIQNYLRDMCGKNS